MTKIAKNNTSNDPFFESLSPMDFDTTLERLSKEIESRSWNISHIYDLQKTMEKHGKIVNPVKVFSICHPKHSSKILEKDDERIVSTMMPCRISVYEKSDGRTYISRINAPIIATMLGGIIEQVMTDSANDVEEIIQSTLHP